MEHIDSAGVSTASRNAPRDWIVRWARMTIAERQHGGFAVASDDWSCPHSQPARHQFLRLIKH